MSEDHDPEVPVWLTPRNPDETIASRLRRWAIDEANSESAVTVACLKELLDQGMTPVPKFRYSLQGLGEWPTRPTNRAVDFRRAMYGQAVALLSHNAPEIDQDTAVYSWNDQSAFPLIIDYLEELAGLLGKQLTDFTIVGSPTAKLITSLEEPLVELDTVLEDEGALVTKVLEKLNSDLNVVVEGVAGSGKSHLLDQLREHYHDRIELVVFHPSTSYEEFVSGLRPTRDGHFVGEAGLFVSQCQRAASAPDVPHLLFIDEINRANTSRVFGDLMLPLEKSKRTTFSEPGEALSQSRGDGVSVRLQTPVTDGDQELKYLVVPANLHVLGTMNSTDRSVGTIDLALRRRFAWLESEPLTSDELQEIPSFADKITDTEESEDWFALLTWFDEVNRHLNIAIGPDGRLGHSYFFAATSCSGAIDALLNQLVEVVQMFNMSEADLTAVPQLSRPSTEKTFTVQYQGAGLGRRPRIASTEGAGVG